MRKTSLHKHPTVQLDHPRNVVSAEAKTHPDDSLTEANTLKRCGGLSCHPLQTKDLTVPCTWSHSRQNMKVALHATRCCATQGNEGAARRCIQTEVHHCAVPCWMPCTALHEKKTHSSATASATMSTPTTWPAALSRTRRVNSSKSTTPSSFLSYR